MKKASLSACFALGFLTLVSGAYAADVQVSHVEGAPMIVRQGQATPAQIGSVCELNDTIKTEAGCVVDVSINNLAGCRLLPASECLIAQAEPESMKLVLNSGNAILNLEKLPANSTFHVETPTAVAAVRGTQFWGRVDTAVTENPVTTFAVREGSVEIFAKAAGQNYSLMPGQALDIPKDGTSAPTVREALEGEMQAMAQADAIKTAV